MWVREVGAIDNAGFRELNRVDTLTASQKLRRLRDAGLLKQMGRGSATYYIPTDLLLGEGLSPMVEPLSTMVEPLSTMVPDVEVLRAGLSEDLLGRIADLGRRGSPEQTLDLVVDLCRVREFSAEELAALLGRERKYVLNNYLRPLLQEGRLAYSIPEQPRHPGQRYRAGQLRYQ